MRISSKQKLFVRISRRLAHLYGFSGKHMLSTEAFFEAKKSPMLYNFINWIFRDDYHCFTAALWELHYGKYVQSKYRNEEHH